MGATKRNQERVHMVQFYLTNNATSAQGKTTKEISSATGISGSAVNRVLWEPGFYNAEYPVWPKSYYFDAERAVSEEIALSQIERAQREAEFKKSMPVVRDYNKQIDSISLMRAINAVTDKANVDLLADALKEYREQFVEVIENVEKFKETTGTPLDVVKAQELYAKGLVLQATLETMIRSLSKFGNPVDNPEWWSEFN